MMKRLIFSPGVANEIGSLAQLAKMYKTIKLETQPSSSVHPRTTAQRQLSLLTTLWMDALCMFKLGCVSTG